MQVDVLERLLASPRSARGTRSFFVQDGLEHVSVRFTAAQKFKKERTFITRTSTFV